jgi:hypothetical protein
MTIQRQVVIDRALLALMSGATMPAAAEQAGCSYATLVKFVKTPEFTAALDALRDRILTENCDKLRIEFSASLKTLLEIRDNKFENAAVRLSAAKTIIALVLQLDKIDKIENLLAAQQRKILDGDSITPVAWERS